MCKDSLDFADPQSCSDPAFETSDEEVKIRRGIDAIRNVNGHGECLLTPTGQILLPEDNRAKDKLIDHSINTLQSF